MKGRYVYIIVRCAEDSLYTGYATDLAQRVTVHNMGKGAKYTRARLPVTLLTAWSYPSQSEALSREYQIKQLPRNRKVELVEIQPFPGVSSNRIRWRFVEV